MLRRIDKAYKSFFRRVKRGDTAGFPRFKNAKRFNSITFPSYGDGCKLKDKKIYLQGIGDINIRLHRPIDGVIKTITIERKNSKYYVCFSCEVEKNILPKTNKTIGIDMGLESFAVTSDKDFIDNPRFFKNSQRKLRILQRSVSRKKKGGNNRKKAVKLLAKQHEIIANQRRDFLHKEANEIIKTNDIICIEDLNIKNMSKRAKPIQDESGKFLPNRQAQKSGLNKSINDAAWGIFFEMLIYKAESADKEVRKVNPRGTSQRCSQCGTDRKSVV